MGVAFTKPVRLEDGQTLGGFHCGVEVVDSWASERAALAGKNGTAVVYVSYCDGEVAGFYSLSSHSVNRDDVRGGWLKRNVPCQIPVVLMGMLGVDEKFKGMRLGSNLLHDAISRAFTIAETIGVRAFLVDPANDAARSFYEHYGFKPLPGTSRMFVPLARNESRVSPSSPAAATYQDTKKVVRKARKK